MPETLTGLIERVTYHNPENGFAVLKVVVKGRQDLVTVVGSTTSVSAGEHLEATGKWVVDREHGQQFKADELKTTHPASAEGIEKYLASGAIRSIGPKLAAKIVSLYKERTLEIFETAPDFLLHIKGIGQERVKRIRQSWQEQKEVRKIMLFLAEHGISSGRAVRIYRTYGQESIAKIKENPYQLADDIRGIGFKTADELAAKMGIDRNSPYRARAAVQYTLQELASQGHVGYPEPGVVEHTTKLVEIDQLIVEEAVKAAVAEKIGHPGEHRRRILALPDCPASGRSRPCPVRSSDRIGHAASHAGHRRGEGHRLGRRKAGNPTWLLGNRRRSGRRASRRCWSSRAGRASARPRSSAASWKSSTAKKLKCVLAAPTGRAAKRLAETTGQTAKTIHRLLGVRSGHRRLQAKPAEPAHRRSVRAGRSFDGRCRPGPSVLPGRPFQCLRDPGRRRGSASLGRPWHRSGRPDFLGCGAGRAADRNLPAGRRKRDRHRRLRHQPGPDAEPQGTREGLTDFYFIEAEEPEAIQDLIVRLVKERIPKRFGFDPKTDIQVLTPMNRSVLGARNLNQVLQTALNPGDGGPEIQRFGWTFRIGDRVIQTENDYNRDVFNGDLGVIEKINRIEQEMVVNFEGRQVEYDFGDLDEIGLGLRACRSTRARGRSSPASSSRCTPSTT